MEVKLSFRQFSHGEFSGRHAHRKYSYCQRKAAVPTDPRFLKSIAKVDLSGRARDFDRLLDEEEGSIPSASSPAAVKASPSWVSLSHPARLSPRSTTSG